MGANNSMSNKLQHNGSIDEQQLSEAEIKLIVSIWELIPDKEIFGKDIMIRIFQEHKEIKNKWIFATNLQTEAEMLSNPQVRYHANKIVDVFDKIIRALTVDGFSDVVDLNRLGKSHFYYEVRRCDFKHFEESMIFSLKKHTLDKKLWSAKAERAYQKAFWHVANKISDGIEREEAAKGKAALRESVDESAPSQ